jgi:hypothetical protein
MLLLIADDVMPQNTEKQFHMVVTREFEASFPYEVTRTFKGSIEVTLYV